MEDDLDILPAEACDDCWQDFSVYWTAGDNRRRCNHCFDLYAAIASGTGTQDQVTEYGQLMGVEHDGYRILQYQGST